MQIYNVSNNLKNKIINKDNITTKEEKTFIEYNLLNFQKENEIKESQLQAKLKDLFDNNKSSKL